MKHRAPGIAGLWVVCAVGAVATAALADPVVDEARGKARAAVAGLGESLKQQLSAALKAGGPKAALDVCADIAPAMTSGVAESHGLEISRTALKVRNPDNAADDFEQRVLEEFAARLAGGEDPAALEHGEIVTEDGDKEYRFMKAIPMAAEPCLVCHGPSIEPALAAEIKDIYPEDQATGFKPGDLRGAFSVRFPVP